MDFSVNVHRVAPLSFGKDSKRKASKKPMLPFETNGMEFVAEGPASSKVLDNLALMLRPMNKARFLTKPEELSLGKEIQNKAAQKAKIDKALDKLSKEGLPSRASFGTIYEWVHSRLEAARAYQMVSRQWEEARTRLLTPNMRLVVKLAKSYQHRGIALADLIQMGNLAAVYAVDKYTHRRNCKFSTFATLIINQKLGRETGVNQRTIQVSLAMIAKVGQYVEAINQFINETGGAPSDPELLAKLKIKPRTLKTIRQAHLALGVASMDQEFEGGEGSLKDVIKDKSAAPEMLPEKPLASKLAKAIDTHLDEDTAEIIRRRFGMAPFTQPETLEEVGRKFGLTKERIRQIQNKGFRILRKEAGEVLEEYFAGHKA